MLDEPIFFSYSRSDSNFVLKLAKDLRKAGANIWLDQLDIKAGSHWDSSIETALNKSTRLIIVLSPASVASNNVMDEVSYALETNKTVIPILLTECIVPFRLRRVQRVNFTGDYHEAFNQLIEVLGYSPESAAESELIKTETAVSQVISTEIKPVAEQKDKELETSIWENAKAENTLDALIEYLQQYPNGTYQTNAVTAIKAIEEIEKQKAFEAAEQHKKEETENKLWEETVTANSISSYQKYLDETVTGLHTKEAQQLIDELEKEQKKKALEASLWENAKAENTLNALNQYVQQYPNGTFQTDAVAAIKAIEEIEKRKAFESAEQLKREETENKLWEETVTANSISSYRKYLDETATGLHKEEVQQRINKLEKEQKDKALEASLWENARAENTINSYTGYLQHYANGLYRTEAAAAIKEIEAAEIKQQEMVVEKEKAPAAEIEKKGSSKKYFLIAGGAVLIAVAVWMVMNYTAPVTINRQISSLEVDSTLASQNTTSVDTQQSQVSPPVNSDSVSSNVNQTNNSALKDDTAVSTFNGNAPISTKEKKYNKDSPLANNTPSKKIDNPSGKSKSVTPPNESSEIKNQNTPSPYSPNDIVKTLDLHVSINYNDIVSTGKDNYAFTYYLAGDSKKLNEIKKVAYQRLPTDWFSNPNFQSSKNRQNNFGLKLYQYGYCNSVNVIVTLNDGTQSDIAEKVIIYDNRKTE